MLKNVLNFMVLISLKPFLAKLLISPRELERRHETAAYLEERIKAGEWDSIPPIWVTPNFGPNGLFRGILSHEILAPTLKPLIVYNGHHRLEAAIKYGQILRAYVRYTPSNPPMPKFEKLTYDTDG